jgi:RND superfamily putative drug exporter
VFAAIGRFAYRRRRIIVLAWVVAFAAGLAATAHVPSRLKGGGFTNPATPSQTAQRKMQDRLGFGPAQLTIVFTDQTLDARSPAFQARVKSALSGIDKAAFPKLLGVQTAASTGNSGFVSGDGHATFAVLSFDAVTEQVQRMIPAIREKLRPTGLKTYITGDAAVYADIESTSARDLRVAESYTIPVAVIVLVLVFGTLVAAALPVIGGGMAVTVTLGCFWVLSHFLDISVFAMNVATLLGLAVGIDYSLFMVGRFREELRAGHSVEDSVVTTVEFAGRSIFFSGLTVVVGLLGLVGIPFMSMRSMGLGGALVVVFSVLAALTLLPALLAILGTRVNDLRIIGRSGKQGAFWGRWSDGVMRHPVVVLIGTLAIVLAFAWPVLHIQREIPGATALPQSSESRKGYDILQSRFDVSALSPIDALVTWQGPQDPLAPANLQRLSAYGRKLQAMPGVARVVSIVNLPGTETPASAQTFWRAVTQPLSGAQGTGAQASVAGLPSILQGLLGAQERTAALRLKALTTAPGTALFEVVPKAPPSTVEAQDLAVRIYDQGPPPGAALYIGGTSMTVHDFISILYRKFPWIILFVVCVTAFVLLLLLRSVVLPVKAVIMNVLSLLAGYGAVVWIFQDGHLEWLFNFRSSGAIDAELPVILFCTVFGVSMDYEVFLLTRMREDWIETGDNVQAVAFGLARTGRIITSAALIIVVVGLSFAFTSILVTKAIGVGLAVAVALDATVIRILMAPAFMRLLGHWNWWLPPWLERVLPRIE